MCVLKPRVQKWVNFSKNGHFWPFFSGNFRDFRGFGGFPGEKFPGNRGIFRRNFPRGFSRNRLYLCVHPKKNRKKPPGFSGDFPGISRGIFRGFPGDFFRKKPGFSSIFTPFYRRVSCSTARVLEKTPKFPEKFPGISGIPGNPRKKFPEIPGNSVRQVSEENFPDFPKFMRLRISHVNF